MEKEEVNNMPDANGRCVMVLHAFLFLSISDAVECTLTLTYSYI